MGVNASEDVLVKPVFNEDGINFVYIQHNNVYLLGVTQRNSNCVMILAFLYRLVDVLKDYFKELEEESIKDNFVITYELLDEMMDNGYPQTTEVKIPYFTVSGVTVRYLKIIEKSGYQAL